MKLFDAHFHIIDHEFPLTPNHGFLPDEFTCDDYRRETKEFDIVGGAIVSGSFHEFDQSYLKAALKELGPSFVGVTQIPSSTIDEQILRLHQAGVRAVRFNLRRGGSAGIDGMSSFAHRIYDLVGWHTELYVDSSELADLYTLITELPIAVIDHLGLSKKGFPTLLKLVDQGTFVKATGFGRVNFDISSALRDLIHTNPDAILFGTDLPSTRAPRPFRKQDIELIKQAADAPETIEKIFYRNAVSLYQPGDKAADS
ncbi:amidohydrolase family protein [Fodinibius salsisoli]|uniref:Amidohydrolase family protein n=1 Tax=Fodinibius salsisoli TaxID=2820877 RepID=A0ABT3PLV4_9BACT|nr:amidohydrolase family protein [Fodinibius salsisoli]MCW9706703.1 amidohydrolase family protein [Fodinibius salsisoli]